MMIDESELQEWVQQWFTAQSEEELEALKRIFIASGATYEDFKARLISIGWWSHNMEMLQTDTKNPFNSF